MLLDKHKYEINEMISKNWGLPDLKGCVSDSVLNEAMVCRVESAREDYDVKKVIIDNSVPSVLLNPEFWRQFSYGPHKGRRVRQLFIEMGLIEEDQSSQH